MKIRKVIMTFFLGMALIATPILGHATMTYVLNKVIDDLCIK